MVFILLDEVLEEGRGGKPIDTRDQRIGYTLTMK